MHGKVPASSERTAARRLVSDDDPWVEDAAFLAEVMIATYEHRRSQVGPPTGIHTSRRRAAVAGRSRHVCCA